MVTGFYDRRQKNWPNFYEALEKLFKRQIGVVLQHRRSSDPDLQLEIKAKRSHHESMRRHLISPEYPDFDIPDLMDQAFKVDDQRYVE